MEVAIDYHALVGSNLHRLLQSSVGAPKIPSYVVRGVGARAKRGTHLVRHRAGHDILERSLGTKSWIVGQNVRDRLAEGHILCYDGNVRDVFQAP